METTPTPDMIQLLQENNQLLFETGVFVGTILKLIMIGICGFVAWKTWTRLLFPIIKNYIKFPL